MKARPSAPTIIMEEDITAQLCMAIPTELYAKCVSNFHLKGDEIANKYDEMISRFKCDNSHSLRYPSKGVKAKINPEHRCEHCIVGRNC